MSTYTDADVDLAAAAAVQHEELSPSALPDSARCLAFDILHDVANPIAARALRQAADRLDVATALTAAQCADLLRAFADVIEAQP